MDSESISPVSGCLPVLRSLTVDGPEVKGNGSVPYLGRPPPLGSGHHPERVRKKSTTSHSPSPCPPELRRRSWSSAYVSSCNLSKSSEGLFLRVLLTPGLTSSPLPFPSLSFDVGVWTTSRFKFLKPQVFRTQSQDLFMTHYNPSETVRDSKSKE